MKKFLTTVILVLSITGLNAQSMIINKTDGSSITVSLGSIDKITFTSGGTIPTNGLIAYYPFNGNANDESGNGNNGTNSGTTITTDRFGNSNKSYSFNGSSSNILVPLFHPPVNNFSFSVWVNCSQLINSGFLQIMGDAGMYQGFWLTQNKDSIHFSIQKGSSGSGGTGSGIAIGWNSNDLNSWVHIAGTNSSGIMKIYKNGVLFRTIKSIQCDNGAYVTFAIGYQQFDWDRGHYFKGKLDDIRIYNRGLSDSEINALYHEGGW